MAKITIVIEDIPQGKIKVTCDPPVVKIMHRHLSGYEMTGAHGYALCALNAVREESRKRGQGKILLPHPGRN